MTDFKINEDIVGTFSKKRLLYCAKLASEVPENGRIFEVGVLAGRVSYALGMNKHQSVKLTCIDQFIEHENCSHFKSRGDLEVITRGDWMYNTRNIENAHSLKLTFPFPVQYPGPPSKLDLVVLGTGPGQSFEQVTEQLTYWHPHLKTGGIILLPGYFDKYPEVVRAVAEFVTTNEVLEVKNNVRLAHIVKV